MQRAMLVHPELSARMGLRPGQAAAAPPAMTVDQMCDLMEFAEMNRHQRRRAAKLRRTKPRGKRR
jgi:hypothetical protein